MKYGKVLSPPENNFFLLFTRFRTLYLKNMLRAKKNPSVSGDVAAAVDKNLSRRFFSRLGHDCSKVVHAIFGILNFLY
jgi:hypothetical protein